MKNKQAFTLIELLVVVLIIGILAAVALPQYQVTVEKSRLATDIPLLKSIKDAEQAYLLANGAYTVDMDELSISLPDITSVEDENQYMKRYHLNRGTTIRIYDAREALTGQGEAFVSCMGRSAYIWTSLQTNHWRCYAIDTKGTKVCKALGCTGTVPVQEGGCKLPL